MIWNRRRHRRGQACDTDPAATACPWADQDSEGTPQCPLSTVSKGCRCRIRRHHGHGAVRQRLLDMGFVPNAEVEVMRVATLGDPMEIKVGDSYVTLRKREAAQIEITPM